MKKIIHLNIKTIKFPITAIVSIFHRISGVLLFISVGPTLWILKASLSSNEKFTKITDFVLMHSNITKFWLWGIITTLIYHIVAGIRHMLIDCGYLQSNWNIGKISAKITCILIIVLSILSGIFIWYPLNQY